MFEHIQPREQNVNKYLHLLYLMVSHLSIFLKVNFYHERGPAFKSQTDCVGSHCPSVPSYHFAYG